MPTTRTEPIDDPDAQRPIPVWSGVDAPRPELIESGQTTAEYALVILGAAAVALLVLAWATQTSGVARLLDAVVDNVISRIT